MTTPWPYPLWIAHRGAGKLAPENTLAAFRVGASHGYRAFECDVKLSADGLPFLLHDATLQRTTPARGTAAKRPWSELSRLDAGGWHSRALAGEPLPSLEAVAQYCIRNGFALNIEIKPTPGQEEATGRVVAAQADRLWSASPVAVRAEPVEASAVHCAPFDKLRANGIAASALKPLLSSFQPDALAAAQASAPTLPRALLLDSLRRGWLNEALRMNCSAVVAQHQLMTARVIAQIHAAGMRALSYTVNEPGDAQRLLKAGIDGLITDAVDRFSPGTGLYS